MVNSAGRR